MKVKEKLTTQLRGIKTFLSSINQGVFVYKSSNESSIGAHIRHVLEFLELLRSTLVEESTFINYDLRQRNIEVETDINEATIFLDGLISFYQNSSLIEEKSISLRQEFDGEAIDTTTSVTREIVYNIEHVVHHLAIIKLQLKKNWPSIDVSDNFGVAESTIKYRNVHAGNSKKL